MEIQLVRDYMTSDPAHIHMSDDMLEALRIMDTDRYRHLPVVNDQEKVVGMLSDRDLLNYTRGAESVRTGLEESSGMPVSKVMATPVEEIGPDEDMQSAAQRLLDSGHGALVVIDGNKLTGILSYVDVLRAFVDLSSQTEYE